MFDVKAWLLSDEDCYEPFIEDPYEIDWAHPSTFQAHVWFWIICFICTVCATLLTIQTLVLHFRWFTNKSEQKHICRILLMVPIYAIDSFLSFRFYGLAIYFDVVRDCYEAFVIYSFVELLIAYAGGYEEAKDMTASLKERRMVAPICFLKMIPRRGLLRHVKRLTLQYVFIRPLMTFLTVILQATRQFCTGNFSPIHGYLWVTVINFFSVTCAMYGLLTFYGIMSAKNEQDHEAHKAEKRSLKSDEDDIDDGFETEIDKKKVLWKFFSVKFVIFLSFWQSIVIALIMHFGFIEERVYWRSEDLSGGIQDFLICLEMLAASIWHAYVFNESPYKTGEPTNVWKSFLRAFNPADIGRELARSFQPKPKRVKPKIKSYAGPDDQQPEDGEEAAEKPKKPAYIRFSVPHPKTVIQSFSKKTVDKDQSSSD